MKPRLPYEVNADDLNPLQKVTTVANRGADRGTIPGQSGAVLDGLEL